jgi:hypothetical protein
MPSGSHRGSRGGSHSSGGSRRGSSFSGGFSSRSSFGGSHYRGRSYHSGPHYYHHRPFRIHFGRRYYVYGSGTTSVFGLLGALFIFALIFTFCFSMVRNADKHEIQLIEEDYGYYQHMISEAREREANGQDGWIVDATVSGRFYNEDADKYYITYYINDSHGDKVIDGYTYSCFTKSEAYSYTIGDTIEIAVDSVPYTRNTDSINTSYYAMPIENDGEYVFAKNELRTSNIIYTICILVDVAIVAAFFILLYKKAVPDNNDSAETNTSTPSTSENNEKYCSYCGSLMSKSSSKCPSCGAGGRK